MDIREKMRGVPDKLLGVIKAFPVELGLFLYLFVILAFYREDVLTDVSFLILVPLFIGIAYVLNNLFTGGGRFFYYLSWVPLVPLSLWVNWSNWVESPQCIITLCILVPIGILLCRRQRENRKFVGDLLKYVYSGGFSVLLSGIAFALSMAIFFSVVYIFKILEGHQMQEAVVEYSAMVAFLLLFPVIFFTFLPRALEEDFFGSRVTDTLLNYIVTPALLIYTTILYLYFIQIIVLWELPQGGIAYLVFGFIILAMIVQALQMFVIQQLYNWYFNWFSFLSIPALIMFWIGVVHRVQEYGLTEWRIYLLVCGVIMTVGVGLFMLKRLGNYLNLFVFSFMLFAAMAYIPGLSAEKIAVSSQLNRVHNLAADLNLLDSKGHLIVKEHLQEDTSALEDYHQLYESISYLDREEPSQVLKLGLSTPDEFLQSLPGKIRYYVEFGREEVREESDRIWIRADGTGWESGLSGYEQLYLFEPWKNSGVCYSYKDNELTLRKGDSVLFSMNGRELVEAQLKSQGYSLEQLPDKGTLDAIAPELLVYKTDSLLLKMHEITISIEQGKAQVIDIEVDLLLVR